MIERQLTYGPGGRILTNCNVWSPCGEWVVFDTRSDAAGSTFDGTRIQAVHLHTGEVRTLYESQNGACCGVATWHPTELKVVFILGPDHPTAEYSYGPSRRQGVVMGFDPSTPERKADVLFAASEREAGVPTQAPSRSPGRCCSPHALDARDLTPPFTPGALRGGTHVHVWHPRGDWLSFTYDDDVIPHPTRRNVGVCFPRPVSVPKSHPRNHSGGYFSVLVTRTGDGGLLRACEEAWVGTSRMLAFHGTIREQGREVAEVFVAQLPDDLTIPGDGPLEGTPTSCPAPPLGVAVRRLTHCGIGGPRHWLRSSPDGSRIGFLRLDAAGVFQLWTVAPSGGDPVQITTGRQPIKSAFTWHPDGERVACVIGGQVCLVDASTGAVNPLTGPCDPSTGPRPEACVVSPDGRQIAFVRRLPSQKITANQICVVGEIE